MTYNVFGGTLNLAQSVTAEALSGQFYPKFQVERVAPTNHFCTDG